MFKGYLSTTNTCFKMLSFASSKQPKLQTVRLNREATCFFKPNCIIHTPSHAPTVSTHEQTEDLLQRQEQTRDHAASSDIDSRLNNALVTSLADRQTDRLCHTFIT